MENLINDLDNNLVKDESHIEVFSGFRFAAPVTLPKEKIKVKLTQLTAGGNNGSPVNIPVQEQVVIAPSPVSEDEPIYSTQPVHEAVPLDEEMPAGDDGMIGMPPMGGGGGMPPMEEEVVVDDMARMTDDKILGLNPKLFYGLLVVAALGGYLYFRKAKAVKSK